MMWAVWCDLNTELILTATSRLPEDNFHDPPWPRLPVLPQPITLTEGLGRHDYVTWLPPPSPQLAGWEHSQVPVSLGFSFCPCEMLRILSTSFTTALWSPPFPPTMLSPAQRWVQSSQNTQASVVSYCLIVCLEPPSWNGCFPLHEWYWITLLLSHLMAPFAPARWSSLFIPSNMGFVLAFAPLHTHVVPINLSGIDCHLYAGDI